jgi:hypothetical protein
MMCSFYIRLKNSLIWKRMRAERQIDFVVIDEEVGMVVFTVFYLRKIPHFLSQ